MYYYNPIKYKLTQFLCPFISAYNSQQKLEQFYSCLLKNSLEREDVANLEQENIKNSHEIQQMFRNSRDCHDSYLFR